MQLSITPSTSIHPLGEEHLRMFRRTVGPEFVAAPRITLPKEAIGRIHLSTQKVKYTDAQELARKCGGRLATLLEVAMDKRFLETADDGTWVFIDWKGVTKRFGNYRINRERSTLDLISKERAIALPWKDRLLLGHTVKEAIEDEIPLAFAVDFRGNGDDRSWIQVLGDYYIGNGDVARIAFVKR